MGSDFDLWIQSLKAGDEVIFCSGRVESVRRVIRVTKAQVMVNVGDLREYEQAFRKKNGYAVGSNTWSLKLIKQPNAETIQAIRDKSEHRRLSQWLERSKFTLAQLQAMEAAFKEASP